MISACVSNLARLHRKVDENGMGREERHTIVVVSPSGSGGEMGCTHFFSILVVVRAPGPHGIRHQVDVRNRHSGLCVSAVACLVLCNLPACERTDHLPERVEIHTWSAMESWSSTSGFMEYFKRAILARRLAAWNVRILAPTSAPEMIAVPASWARCEDLMSVTHCDVRSSQDDILRGGDARGTHSSRRDFYQRDALARNVLPEKGNSSTPIDSDCSTPHTFHVFESY